jgi:hypothetical protein
MIQRKGAKMLRRKGNKTIKLCAFASLRLCVESFTNTSTTNCGAGICWNFGERIHGFLGDSFLPRPVGIVKFLCAFVPLRLMPFNPFLK